MRTSTQNLVNVKKTDNPDYQIQREVEEYGIVEKAFGNIIGMLIKENFWRRLEITNDKTGGQGPHKEAGGPKI